MNRLNPMKVLVIIFALVGTVLALRFPTSDVQVTGSSTLDLSIWVAVAIGAYECWAHLLPHYMPSLIIRPLQKWRRRRRRKIREIKRLPHTVGMPRGTTKTRR